MTYVEGKTSAQLNVLRQLRWQTPKGVWSNMKVLAMSLTKVIIDYPIKDHHKSSRVTTSITQVTSTKGEVGRHSIRAKIQGNYHPHQGGDIID